MERTVRPSRPDRHPDRIQQGTDTGASADPTRPDAHLSVCLPAWAAAGMASDLSTTPVTGLRVQACGDCHLMNFGAFATPERNLIFDINDFDETLPAPWEWDLKRLAASVIAAGRYIGLSERNSMNAALSTVRSCRRRIAQYADMRAMEIWYDRIDIDRTLEEFGAAAQKGFRRRVEKTRGQSSMDHDFPELVESTGESPHIRDNPPLNISRGDQSRREPRPRQERAEDVSQHPRRPLPRSI